MLRLQRSIGEPEAPVTNTTSNSWWVPISMTDSERLGFSPKDRLPVVWLTPRKPSVEIPTLIKSKSWVLVNIESSGYYRVNYDRRNWELLSEQLNRDHNAIPYLTRAQLVDDAFSLGHAKIIPYEIALDVIRYLEKTDDDFLIRRIAENHIELIETSTENTIKNFGNEVFRFREFPRFYKNLTDLFPKILAENHRGHEKICVSTKEIPYDVTIF